MNTEHPETKRRRRENVFQPAEDMKYVEKTHTEEKKNVIFKAADENVESSSEFVWHSITEEQKNGKSFFVAKNKDGNGTLAYWRRTRVMLHSRWSLQGKWTETETRRDLEFEPLYYREVV